jgi:hypothetical protein
MGEMSGCGEEDIFFGVGRGNTDFLFEGITESLSFRASNNGVE